MCSKNNICIRTTLWPATCKQTCLSVCLSVCHSSVSVWVHCWSECYSRLTSLSPHLNTTEGNLKISCYWTSAPTVWLCVCIMCVCPCETSLAHAHTLLQLSLLTAFSPSSYSFPYLPSAHTHTHTLISTHSTVLLCTYECVSVHFCSMHVCTRWRTAFHSWIKPGQRPRGLQVNVAYFKRLLLHGHSVSNAHTDTHAFRYAEDSQQGKASGCGLHICLLFQGFVWFLKSAYSLSFCFCFPLFSSLPVSNISLTFLSFCFLLSSFFFYMYFNLFFSFTPLC